MKNNKGFIAISLIYSFLLIFLMTLMAVVADYAHNRILLNDVKKTTQNKLNSLSEFNPISLKSGTYTAGDTITYADDSWEVIKDNGNSVILILARSLNNTELTSGLSSTYHSAISGNTINMCYSGYTADFCCYNSSNAGQYNLYYWDDSFVKNVLDYWFLNNTLLQKALDIGTLKSMSFSDGRKTYSSYVRIPTVQTDPIKSEYNNNNVWSLTYKGNDSKQSLIYVNTTSVVAHTTYKEIRPIIEVKEATT